MGEFTNSLLHIFGRDRGTGTLSRRYKLARQGACPWCPTFKFLAPFVLFLIDGHRNHHQTH
jgi:hypothetical protein